jgi:chemotaxis response regulator CheB
MAVGRSRQRVVVVEDSTTVCAYLCALATEAGFEVAGSAQQPAEGERLVRAERPDLVLSDFHLQGGDGIELTGRLLAERGMPIILITAQDHRNPELIFRAMQAGALEVLPKPPARSSPDFPPYFRRFQTTLRTLAGVPVVRRRPRVSAPAPRAETVAAPRLEGDAAVIAIGASTGGPVLVGDLLRSLAGRRFAFAVVAQHIVPDFADGFRAWLAEHTGRPVRAARNGEIPEPGGIYTIPGSCHLQLAPDGRFRVESGSCRDTLHVPSVDVLFTSLAALRPRSTIAILLTGMGHDGAEGLLCLRQAGALTVAQAPASAAVDSMPRSAIQRDAVAQVLAPPEIARLLEQLPSAALTRHR